MAEPLNTHGDLGAYLLDMLAADERAAFEAHLAGCGRCRREAVEIEQTLKLLERRVELHEPPPALQERTMAAVKHAAAEDATGGAPVVTGRRRWALRSAAVAAAAALGVAGFLAGTGADDDGLPGAFELSATLSGPNREAHATVHKVGEGRVVEFRSDELPILPTGQFYELWFVGPGDSPDRPNRISAGTFHPDENGRSLVRFTAAVDPEKYPQLAVTREPGDGSPVPTPPDVLRSPPAG